MDDLFTNINALLFSPAFTLFGAPTTWLEVIGFITGAICVYGVVIQKIWNYYWAVFNTLAWALLFWTYGLYMDGVLQLAFLVLSVYGWFKWMYGGTEGKDTLPVVKATRKQWAVLTVITIVATVAIASLSFWFQSSFLETVQTTFIIDASILTFSLLATYMQTKKIFEAWWIWIGIDVVSIPLYVYKGLVLTAIEYVVFLLLCIQGLLVWRKTLRKQTVEAVDNIIDNVALNIPNLPDTEK